MSNIIHQTPDIDVSTETPEVLPDNIVTIHGYDPATFLYSYSTMADTDEPIASDTTQVTPPEYNLYYEQISFNLATQSWDISTVPTPLDGPKEAAEKSIDIEIKTVLGTISTSEAQNAGLYDLKYTESLKYIADGEPADLTSYPFIDASVLATGMTAIECANQIISKHDEYVAMLVSIENIRLLAKAQIAAVHEDGVATIDELISDIDNIAKNAVTALLKL